LIFCFHPPVASPLSASSRDVRSTAFLSTDRDDDAHRSNRPQVSGVSRTGKQARKQLKLARRADKEKTKRDEDEKTSGCAKKDVTGDVAMAD